MSRKTQIIFTKRVLMLGKTFVGVKVCDIPRKLTREELAFTSKGYSFFNKEDLSKSFLEMCSNK